MKQTMIDVPSGWMFGFPKVLPNERKNDVIVWLGEQGYPKAMIDDLGDYFYCRYWEVEKEVSRTIISIRKEDYLLLLSKNPCELFRYFGVDKMHGLSLKECEEYNNTEDDSYIAGLCNYIPKKSGEYDISDPCFVFINTSRCKNDIKALGLIMHEMMHMSFKKHLWDIEKEEEIITWAGKEANDVLEIVLKFIKNDG